MVDFPATATFLTPEERAYVIWRKSEVLNFFHNLLYLIIAHSEYDNSSVGEEEQFEMRHLIAAITDWQVCSCVLRVGFLAALHRTLDLCAHPSIYVDCCSP